MWSRGAYAPDEILNSMFLPLMKKSIGGRRQNYSLFSYNKIFCPSLLCFPQGKNFFQGGRKCCAPFDSDSATDEKYFCPLPPKSDSDPDEKLLDTPLYNNKEL